MWHLDVCMYDSTKWRNKLFIHNINLTGHKNVHIAYCSWLSGRHKLWLCFAIGDRRLFLTAALTMILKCSVQLSIIRLTECNRKYEAKMTSITWILLFIHLLKRTWKNGRVKVNIFLKFSLNFTFCQFDCPKWDFAWSNSSKAV